MGTTVGRGDLGWPEWLAFATVFACLTLGTVAILFINAANTFDVEGSQQFETVGPAAIANLVVQTLAAVALGALALRRPPWGTTGLVAITVGSVLALLALNAWAYSSVPA